MKNRIYLTKRFFILYLVLILFLLSSATFNQRIKAFNNLDSSKKSNNLKPVHSKEILNLNNTIKGKIGAEKPLIINNTNFYEFHATGYDLVKPRKGIIKFHRGNLVLIDFIFITNMIEGEQIEVFINIEIDPEINHTKRKIISWDRTDYSRRIQISSNGSSNIFDMEISWFVIQSDNDSFQIIDSLYHVNYKVIILPNPNDFVLQSSWLIFILMLFFIIYGFCFRNYGKFKSKERLVRPKYGGEFFLLFLLILIPFSLYFIENVFSDSLILDTIIPNLNIFFAHTTFEYYCIFSIFLLILFISSYSVYRQTFWQISQSLKDKKINNKFELVINSSIFTVQILYVIVLVIENLGSNFSSILTVTEKEIKGDLIFTLIPLLSMFVVIFYSSRSFHRFLVNKINKESSIFGLLFLDMLYLYITCILISSLNLWFFLYSNIYFFVLGFAFCLALTMHLIIYLFLGRRIEIVPKDWINIKGDPVLAKPQFKKINMKYSINYSGNLKFQINTFKNENISVEKVKNQPFDLLIKQDLEYGVYRLEIIPYLFKIKNFLFKDFFGMIFYRSFNVYSIINENIVNEFFKSLEMNIERISDIDINASEIKTRKIYRINKVSNSKYSKFDKCIIYILNETANYNVINDCLETVLSYEWVNKNNIFLIVPTPLEMVASIQRTVFQLEEQVSIIPIVFSEIEEVINKQKDKSTQSEQLFESILFKFQTPHNLFSRSISIEDPGQFYGRDYTLSRIVNCIRQNQPFAVIGLYRIGKTSVAKQIKFRMNQDDLYIYLSVGATEVETIILRIWDEMIRICALRIPRFQMNKIIFDKDNPQKSLKEILNLITMLEKDKDRKILIVLDEISSFYNHNFNKIESIQFFNLLRSLNEEHPSFIFCLVLHNDDIITNIDYPITNYLQVHWITGLEYSEAQQMILSIANMMDLDFSYELALRISEYWGGNPSLIRDFCGVLYKEFKTTIPELSDTEFDKFRSDLEFQQFQSSNYEMIWKKQIINEECHILLNIATERNPSDINTNNSYLISRLILKGIFTKEMEFRSRAFLHWIKLHYNRLIREVHYESG